MSAQRYCGSPQVMLTIFIHMAGHRRQLLDLDELRQPARCIRKVYIICNAGDIALVIALIVTQLDSIAL